MKHLKETHYECFSFLQVCEWKDPEELARLLDLELRATGEPQHKLLERVSDVANYSIKTSETARDSRGSEMD